MNIPKNAKVILEKLHSAGFESYIVGGAVRSHVLGLPVQDFDYTTSATPSEVLDVFKGYNTFAPGLKHGTVCVEMEKSVYEITTFRSESGYFDNRHPQNVSFVRSLTEDLKRRDFTINAMCYDGEKIVDIFGGIEDCKNGIIRCIGNPVERFEEDALRILRCIRFASMLGFKVDKNTTDAVFACKRLLNNISVERIRSEFDKILLGKGCVDVLFEFKDVIGQFIPEIIPCFGFSQNSPYHIYDVYSHLVHAVQATPPDLPLRLAAFLHDIGKPYCYSEDQNGRGHFYGHAKKSAYIAQKTLNFLKYPTAIKNEVVTLIENHDNPIVPVECADNMEKYILRNLNRYGVDTLRRLLALKRADNSAKSPQVLIRLDFIEKMENCLKELMDKNPCFTLSSLAVDGNDIKSLGFKGRRIGDALNYLLDAVICHSVVNEKDALLSFLIKNFK